MLGLQEQRKNVQTCETVINFSVEGASRLLEFLGASWRALGATFGHSWGLARACVQSCGGFWGILLGLLVALGRLQKPRDASKRLL